MLFVVIIWALVSVLIAVAMAHWWLSADMHWPGPYSSRNTFRYKAPRIAMATVPCLFFVLWVQAIVIGFTADLLNGVPVNQTAGKFVHSPVVVMKKWN